MTCPFCKSDNTLVVDTRQRPGYRRRRYRCGSCAGRFNTVERVRPKLPRDSADAYYYSLADELRRAAPGDRLLGAAASAIYTLLEEVPPDG